jgi:8-oxo-dGTP diphosphatase
MTFNVPRVGVGVWICKDEEVLLLRRAGSAPSPGTWCPPGGHLEMWESLEECARREVREEAGVEIGPIRLITATDDFFKEDSKHYVTVQFAADWKSGKPKVMEPDKSDICRWFPWENLPEPLSLFTSNFVKGGYNPFNF